MKTIFNTDLPDVFDPLDYKVQPEDAGHELVWYVDPKFFDGRCRVWTINLGDKIKRMGHITPKLSAELDVVFIWYDEPNAQENWDRLKSLCPRAKRIMGVKGVFNAHYAASLISTTDMFYVVDADAYITDFDFEFTPTIFDRNYIHIFKSHNPVNGLEYGNGAVKIFPKTVFNNTPDVDVSTTLGPVKLVDKIVCENRFNSSSFNAWRAGFREAAKLSRQNDKESQDRMMTWISKGQDKPYGIDCMRGAYMGCAFKGDLNLINNYDWLKEQYDC